MAEKFPLVSIITVCRNAEDTIERALRSVAAQHYPALEYIVIDGGSTDATVNRVRACSTVTRWVSEPDDGIAHAFNKGIALARGDWIGILNADDWYEPEAVFRVMACAGEADVVHGSVRYWAGDTPSEIYYPRQNKLRTEMTINHASVFVRRTVYETLGGFDATYRYAMDYELMLRFCAAGCRFVEKPGHVLANMSYGGVSDAHWYKAALESARAKRTHLAAPWSTAAYCFWQITRGMARRMLDGVGLHGAVRWFRRHFSIVYKA